MTERKYTSNEDRRLARNLQSKRYREANKEKVAAGLKEYRKKNYKELSRYSIWSNARDRARKKGLPFSISKEDVVIPEVCPILGMRLEHGFSKTRDNSPSLDRIIPEKGYTVDNIQVISYLANRMKNSATEDQLRRFAKWVEETYNLPRLERSEE